MFKSIKWSTPRFNADGGTAGGGQATETPGAAVTPEKVVIDGVEYTPEQLKELVSKGKDYTKKTQELSRKTQEFETQRQQLERLSEYSQFIQRLESDPAFSQHLVSVVQAYNAQTPGQAPTQTQINTIKQAAEKTDDSDTRTMLEDMQLDMEINKLTAKYDDFDEAAVLEYAEAENIPDLEKAYKLLNYEKHKDGAAKKALEDAKKGSQVPRTQSGTSGSPPGAQKTAPKTWAETDSAASEYLQSLRSSN